MQDQIEKSEYYSITPKIFGSQNAFVKVIYFHKTNNEIIFELNNAEKAKLLQGRLFSLQDMIDSHNLEKNKRSLDFTIAYQENTIYVTVKGNIKNLFEEIIKPTDVQLLSNYFLKSIEENKEISQVIEKSKTYRAESQTSDEFKPVFKKAVNNDQKKETKNNSFKSLCNIL